MGARSPPSSRLSEDEIAALVAKVSPQTIRYGLCATPFIAGRAVLRLAQTHEPKTLRELGVELERLGFAGPMYPIIALSLIVPVFEINEKTRQRRLELVKRWLALGRRQRFVFVTSIEVWGNFLKAYELADTLAELVRAGVQTGEIRLVEGPEAAIDELHLTDLRIFRAVSVVFRADEAADDGGEPCSRRSPDPELLKKLTKYAEQQFKGRGDEPVKQQTLIDHAQRVLGLSYRASRDLARSLPKHPIHPARRPK
jgi:hypothetical protein